MYKVTSLMAAVFWSAFSRRVSFHWLLLLYLISLAPPLCRYTYRGDRDKHMGSIDSKYIHDLLDDVQMVQR